MTDTPAAAAPSTGPAATAPVAPNTPAPATPTPMAAAPGTPSTTTFVADTYYDVTISRVIEWPKGSASYLSPREHHLVRGAVCMEIADGIVTAKPV